MIDGSTLQLGGIHHLTAITARVNDNLAFHTRVLGMRLVKRTVNQDDVSAYHLFYADGRGSPGTDLTYFDWPAARERRGTNSIVRTGLRLAGRASLDWWKERLRAAGVASAEPTERDGRPVLDFEDAEGQRFSLTVDPDGPQGAVWAQSAVPAEHRIHGLGPVHLSVRDAGALKPILVDLLGMRAARTYAAHPGGPEVTVYEMAEGGPAAEVHVASEPDAAPARMGAGGVHHLAFRVATLDDYHAWNRRLEDWGMPASGPVDRFYFRSLYFREPNGILFELATDGPGFATDEPEDRMGERLALPPFLEGRRAEIEAGLKPLELPS
ncbi:MAG: ring-cleaving dioxygenase [Puniceicoccaceae bacterium]|nr:MAG: ring-cleaving dioxygenase [Puniceicoccaceae bacterium]